MRALVVGNGGISGCGMLVSAAQTPAKIEEPYSSVCRITKLSFFVLQHSLTRLSSGPSEEFIHLPHTSLNNEHCSDYNGQGGVPSEVLFVGAAAK